MATIMSKPRDLLKIFYIKKLRTIGRGFQLFCHPELVAESKSMLKQVQHDNCHPELVSGSEWY